MKSEIRTKLTDARDSQPIQQIEEKSRSIQEKFLSLPLVKNANSIFIYNAIRGEVRTRGIIENFLMQGKTVAVPIVDLNSSEIIIARLNNLQDLKKGTFGIPEPSRTDPVPLEQIDVVVVPGIAFDEKGNRIGHGFGFYDKFLGTLKGKPIVALAYEMQLLNEISCEDHDVTMDYIITEKRVLRCSDDRTD